MRNWIFPLISALLILTGGLIVAVNLWSTQKELKKLSVEKQKTHMQYVDSVLILSKLRTEELASAESKYQVEYTRVSQDLKQVQIRIRKLVIWGLGTCMLLTLFIFGAYLFFIAIPLKHLSRYLQRLEKRGKIPPGSALKLQGPTRQVGESLSLLLTKLRGRLLRTKDHLDVFQREATQLAVQLKDSDSAQNRQSAENLVRLSSELAEEFRKLKA